MSRYGNKHGLNGRNFRRQHQTPLVAVRHYYCPYKPCRYTPRSRITVLSYAVFIQELHIEGFCKVLPQIMRSTCLQTFTVKHHRFHSVGCNCACKLFLFGLFARKYGNCKNVFGKIFINVKHLQSFGNRFFFGCMHGMPFLP